MASSQMAFRAAEAVSSESLSGKRVMVIAFTDTKTQTPLNGLL
jgi:hypothetical protein